MLGMLSGFSLLSCMQDIVVAFMEQCREGVRDARASQSHQPNAVGCQFCVMGVANCVIRVRCQYDQAPGRELHRDMPGTHCRGGPRPSHAEFAVNFSNAQGMAWQRRHWSFGCARLRQPLWVSHSLAANGPVRRHLCECLRRWQNAQSCW